MLSKLVKIFKDFGFLNGTLYSLSRCLSRLFDNVSLYKYYIFQQPVDMDIFPGRRRFQNLEVFEISEQDLRYRDDFPPRPGEVIDQRFSQNARCFIAYKESVFTGFLWMVENFYREDEIRCRYVLLPAGQAVWDFDVYVHPQARFGGTFFKLWHEAFRVLQSEGKLFTVSRISAFNINSIKSHERLGAYRTGSVTAFNIFSFQILLTTFRPFFSITINSVPDIIVPVK